jgi:hypothetical protein
MALGIPFHPLNEPSTTGLDWANPKVTIESWRLQDVSRAFDSPTEMPYVERNFRASGVSLNP